MKGQMKTEDLTGQRFGRLTVIKRDEDRVDKHGRHTAMWVCKCECGTIKTVAGGHLKSGHTKSCGCWGQRDNGRSRLDDLTGERFGKLTVVKRAPNYVSPKGQARTAWECKCDCGNTVVVDATVLKSGKQVSCGCHSKALAHKNHFQDLTGKRFDKLVVLGRAEDQYTSGGRKQICYKVQCDCGSEPFVARANGLRNGSTHSCGCIAHTNSDTYARQRLGKTCISRCGLKGTLTKYTNTNHVEVTLEDGSVCKTRYGRVKDGGPFYPEGMSPHLKAKEYHGYTDLSFAFRLDDGSVYFYCKTSDGEEDVLTLRQMYRNECRVGMHVMSKCGLVAELAEYTDDNMVKAVLEDGTVCKTTRQNFLEGSAMYPAGMTPQLTCKEYHGYRDLKLAFKKADGRVYFYCMDSDGIEDVKTLKEIKEKEA